MEVIVMVYVLFAVTIISMMVCHYIAKKRGLKPMHWVIIAAIIGPLAIPLALLVKSKSK